MNRFDQLPEVLQNKIYEYNADHRPQWKDVMRDLIMYDYDEYIEWVVDMTEIIQHHYRYEYIAFWYEVYNEEERDKLYDKTINVVNNIDALRNINRKYKLPSDIYEDLYYQLVKDLKIVTNHQYLSCYTNRCKTQVMIDEYMGN